MPRSFRAASPLKRVSLLLLVLRVVEEVGVHGYDATPARALPCPLWLVLLRAPPVGHLFDLHYAGAGQSKAYASRLGSIKSACWREDGAQALQDCPRREQTRLRREQLRC